MRVTWLILALGLMACQSQPKDDPLVIRDDDTLSEFMFPPTRDTTWTYRRETTGLVEEIATVSVAVDVRRPEEASLSFEVERSEAVETVEVAQGVGLRGPAEIRIGEDGAVTITDPVDRLVYSADGTVSSKTGVEYRLLGTETIQTPAGTFACVKYRVSRSPSEDFPMTLEGTQWWGKGAGLIRAVSTLEGFNAGTRTTLELIHLER